MRDGGLQVVNHEGVLDDGTEAWRRGRRHVSSPSSVTSCWRSRNFWILLEDIGHSLTKRTTLGTLKAATSPLQYVTRSASVAAVPGSSSTNAAGTSTYFASGIPTTWASFTAGCRPSSASISAAATFSPPTFSMSLNRPRHI